MDLSAAEVKRAVSSEVRAQPSSPLSTTASDAEMNGSEILVPQKGKNPRRLTPVEAGRLMGFPDEYLEKITVSDTQAYRQFGNAVCPLVVEAIGKRISAFLKREKNRLREPVAVRKSAGRSMAAAS